MFVKLYSRITESSLMEQPIEVRYTFMMLLAIADSTGRVVGTDIAIARRINLPLLTFVNSVNSLKEPDPDSNSKEEDGRRVVSSDSERGYQIVNYQKYRNLKDENEKREYMRTYMRNRREAEKSVKSVNFCKDPSIDVTQAEAEAEAEVKTKTPPTPKPPKPKPLTDPSFDRFWRAYPNRKAKGAAEKSWKALKPDAELVELILKAIEDQKRSKKWREEGGRFIPYPATWLNQKRWEDEQTTKPTMTKAEIDALAMKMNEEARREAHNPELEDERR